MWRKYKMGQIIIGIILLVTFSVLAPILFVFVVAYPMFFVSAITAFILYGVYLMVRESLSTKR